MYDGRVENCRVVDFSKTVDIRHLEKITIDLV